MGWSEWPAWLKGGVIGLLILAIFGLLSSMGMEVILIVLLVLPYPLFSIISVSNLVQSVFIIILVNIIFFFIVGSVVGLVYGGLFKKRDDALGKPAPSKIKKSLFLTALLYIISLIPLLQYIVLFIPLWVMVLLGGERTCYQSFCRFFFNSGDLYLAIAPAGYLYLGILFFVVSYIFWAVLDLFKDKDVSSGELRPEKNPLSK